MTGFGDGSAGTEGGGVAYTPPPSDSLPPPLAPRRGGPPPPPRLICEVVRALKGVHHLELGVAGGVGREGDEDGESGEDRKGWERVGKGGGSWRTARVQPRSDTKPRSRSGTATIRLDSTKRD